MKEFIPVKNQNKKLIENVLAVSAKVREAKKTNPNIINATSGSYYDDDGNIKVFECVKEAFEKPNYNNVLSYSSVKGTSEFGECVKKWILGDDYKEVYKDYCFNLIATPGGTGALTLGFATYLDKGEGIMLPNIMWPTYLQIAKNLDINEHLYDLFNSDNKLNLKSIEDKAKVLQEKYDKVSLVINDPCHNPTGYVMTEKDYSGLIEVLNRLSEKTKVILILDIAYLDYSTKQGRLTREYFKLLKELSDNVMILFAFSASKTFGIYGLRLGALLQMTRISKEAELFDNASSYFARSTWSNSTHLGMEIVENTLADDTKKHKFIEELSSSSKNLEKRSNLFINELIKYEVPFAPYQNGFFVLILVDDPIFESEIEKEGAYGCHFGKGYRVALSSINQLEAVRLGEIIGKAYHKIKNKN